MIGRLAIASAFVLAVVLGLSFWAAQGEVVWLVQNLAFCA